MISLLYGDGLTVEYDSLNDIYELVPDYTYVQQKLDAGYGIAIRPGTGASTNPEISVLPGTFMPYYVIGDGLTIITNALDDTSTLAVDFDYINTLITLPIAASGTSREGKIDYISTTYNNEIEFRQIFNVSLEKLLDISSKKDVSNITLFANQTASGTYPTYFTVDDIQHEHRENLWDTFTIYFSGVNESTTGMQSFMLFLGFYYTSGEISTISAQIAPYITYQKKLTEGTGIDIRSNGTISVDTTAIQKKLTSTNAGTGISITNDAQGNPVISLDLPQAEGGGF